MREIDKIRPDYSRQATMDDMSNLRNTNTWYVIVGCGGIGFWVGVILAMLGEENFILVDDDRLEKSNIARIPVPVHWVGKQKVMALKRFIRVLRPATKVFILPEKLYSIEQIKKIKTCNIPMFNFCFIDCTDNLHSQKIIYKIANDMSSRYLKIGYEGFDISVHTTPNAWQLEGAGTGYRTTKANAMSSAMAAIFGITTVLFNKDFIKVNGKDFDININFLEMFTNKKGVEND